MLVATLQPGFVTEGVPPLLDCRTYSKKIVSLIQCQVICLIYLFIHLLFCLTESRVLLHFFPSAPSAKCRPCQGCSHSSSSSAAQLHVCDMTRLFGCGTIPSRRLPPRVFLAVFLPVSGFPLGSSVCGFQLLFRRPDTHTMAMPRHCWHIPLTNGHKCIIG